MNTTGIPELALVHIDKKQGKHLAGSYPVYDILSIYLEGGDSYRLNDTTYPATPPFSLLIPVGTYDHDLQDGNIYGICLMFSGRGLLAKSPSAEGEMIDIHLPGQTCTEPMIKEVSNDIAKQLADTLLQIKQQTTPNDSAAMLCNIGLMFGALSIYADAEVRDQETEVHREAERLHELIEENAFTTHPMEDFYKQLNISTAHAQVVFLKAFGLKPVTFRTQLRMNRARELLTITTMNVGEVAYETGYNDPLYFSKVFKKTFGITPSSMITKFNIK